MNNMLANDYFILYTVLGIFSLLIIIVMLIHSRIGLSGTFKDKIYRIAMFSLIVLEILDLFFFYLMHSYIPFNMGVTFTLKSLYYFVGSISAFLWFLYFEAELDSKIVREKKVLCFSMFFILVNAVLLIVNIWTGIIFDIKVDSLVNKNSNVVPIMQRGSAFIAIYICIYSYVLVSCIRCLIRAFNPKYYVESSRLMVYSSFPLIPLLAGAFQYNYEKVPITICSLTLASLILYMVDVANQISQDSLTELNNRRNFMRVLQRSINSLEDNACLYLLMLDLDRFKSINDNYGHVEGDHALIMFSDVLKRSISTLNRRGILARYGGDEFIIMVLVDNDEDLEKFIGTIKTELENANQASGKAYRVETSIGYKKYDKSINIKELIESADQDLYNNKEKAHKRKAI